VQAFSNQQPDSLSPLIELHYFPCLAYFTCLWPYKTILLEAHENYIKQSYRNRCYIRTANKVANLSVPVMSGNTKQNIREVRIDYRENWLKDHWRTIASGYGKAPFFSELAPFFENILFKKHRFLFDLNLEILTMCLRLLGHHKNILLSEQYLEPGIAQPDYRNRIQAKKTDSLSGIYQSVVYQQNFGHDFVPNLSILDILFCEGLYAANIISHSVVITPDPLPRKEF